MSNLNPNQFKFTTSKEHIPVDEFNEGGYDSHMLHLRQNDKPIGNVKYVDTGDELQVDWMSVDKEHRGKGLGTHLMEELYRRHPKHVVNWQTTTEDSAGLAKKFKEKYPDRTEYR